MADKAKQENSEKANAAKPAPTAGNVVSLPHRCAVKDCKQPPSLVNFCKEHYDWFKFGMITKNGEKPVDFDKKYQAFMKHKSKKVA